MLTLRLTPRELSRIDALRAETGIFRSRAHAVRALLSDGLHTFGVYENIEKHLVSSKKTELIE